MGLNVGIVGSAVRDFETAKDIDVLFESGIELERACEKFGVRWSGWDAYNGHVRRANLTIGGVDKPIQFVSSGGTPTLEDHPYATILRDGTVLNAGKFYTKPKGWVYDKVITIDRRKESKMDIAVDFDGVIRSWDTGRPIEGAKNGINLLREQGYKVIIHSCNNPTFVESWLNDYDIRFDTIWNKVGKPIASIYLDDRGLRFTAWDKAIADIKELKDG